MKQGSQQSGALVVGWSNLVRIDCYHTDYGEMVRNVTPLPQKRAFVMAIGWCYHLGVPLQLA